MIAPRPLAEFCKIRMQKYVRMPVGLQRMNDAAFSEFPNMFLFVKLILIDYGPDVQSWHFRKFL